MRARGASSESPSLRFRSPPRCRPLGAAARPAVPNPPTHRDLPMDLNRLRAALRDNPLARDIEHHATLSSTNDRVAELALHGAPEGVIVVAESQSRGRGRRGEHWADVPGGSLLLSVLLRPTFERGRWSLLSLAAAAATATAIRSVSEADAQTKWPNDVVVKLGGHPRKLAGILVEAGERHAVLGVGVNVLAAPDLGPMAGSLPPVSLADLCPRPPSREALLVSIVEHLSDHYGWLDRGQVRELVDAYSCLDMTVGMGLTLHVGAQQVHGVATGVDDTGALVLSTGEGLRRFVAGEVHIDPGQMIG